MRSELKYPVQPFVFEFAKEASKQLNFRDLHVAPSPRIDMSPVEAYLEANGSFLDEFAYAENDQAQSFAAVDSCDVDPVFFRRDFDLQRAEIFETVFPKGCLKSRLFAEKLQLQLEVVQNCLFHSSDQHALEFFKSFSTIHDMHHELSVLLPQVKKMRQDLGDLKSIASSSGDIASLKRKKERLDLLKEYVDAMKQITDAKAEAVTLAGTGCFQEAFDVMDNVLHLITGKLLSVKSLQSYVPVLQETSRNIENQAKSHFFELFKGDSMAASDLGIIEVLLKRNLLSSATAEAVDFIGKYAVESVRRILNESAEARLSKSVNLSTLSVRDFTEVLSAAFPNIRSKILTRATEAITRIGREFSRLGVEVELTPVSQALADKVFKETTTVVSSHPLKGASLDDFSNMFEAMISFGRSFENFMIDKTLIQASLMALSRAFVESLHAEQSARIRATLAVEKWVKREPEREHLEIVKKLAGDLPGYSTTTSLLVLLEVTWNYLQTARKIPKTCDDVASKLVETVRLFNTQSYESLVKGGALQTAKMKNISTKNLALSAAGLEFYMKLIPYMKPRLLVVGANADAVERQFSELVGQLGAHYQTLIDKIIDVLAKIIAKACDSAEIDMYKPSQYAQSISNEVLTLHKGISDCLPAPTLNAIFSKIGAVIGSLVMKVQKTHRGSERHVARDVEYMNDQLKVCHCVISLSS